MKLAAAVALLATSAASAAGPRQHLGPAVRPPVRRVVTLAPSLSEVVLALGAGDRLVGVTRFDDDPRTAKLPRVGGYNDPEPESVLALRPDVVLAEPAPTNRGPTETLGRLGVPVEALPLSTVAQIEEAIGAVAALLGLEQRGRELQRDLEVSRARARESARGKPRVRALLVFGLEPLVVAGPGSFAGELLEDAGGENAAGANELPFFRIPVEVAVRGRSEVIVLCGIERPRGRAVVPGLERVRVASLRSTALLHPGPRLPEALADLAAALRE